MNRRIFLMGVPGLAGCSRGSLRLNIFNWSNYVASSTIPDFEMETGIRVRYAVYESNEEMLARVLSGNSGWDVVFPTHYYIEPMRQNNLLARLDHSYLPNLPNLASRFASPAWDPKLEWSVPYMWGASGILYNPAIGAPPAGWSDMWDNRLQGRMTMLDDPAEVLGAALKKLGLSLNETREAPLRRAQAEALRQKPLLRAYLNAEVRDQVVAGDVLACQAWATTSQQAIDAAPHLRFVYPAEGFALYADSAVILRESRRYDLAHRFIDYLLRPEVAAAVVLQSKAATANQQAYNRLPPGVAALPALFPPADTLARGEWFATMPAAAQRLRDRLWTEIKSA
ncbi:MAG: spermidine/putrescine ABC transporter substrate-binding protein [Bryobacterales bacterium]|nr:spermidine/putrescine ABC transporter substrate-binding protein [Bryobacterales bacterium]